MMQRLVKGVFYFKMISLVLVGVLITCMASAHVRFHINSLIVFGDGATDNGLTQLRYGFPVQPPYWRGRFSDGPVYVEELAYALGLIPNPRHRPSYNRHRLFHDYSYYDAVILRQNRMRVQTLKGYYSPLLATEIAQFIRSKPHIYPPAAMVLFDIGTNDLAAPRCLRKSWHCLQLIASVLQLRIESLYKLGFHRFVLVMPNDLLLQPAYYHMRRQRVAQLRYQEIFPNYQSAFTRVKTRLEKAHPNIQLLLFNAMHYDQQIKKQFAIPSMIPCYDNGLPPHYFYQVAPVCLNPKKHMFFDNYFYGYIAQRELAWHLLEAIQAKNWFEQRYLRHGWFGL